MTTPIFQKEDDANDEAEEPHAVGTVRIVRCSETGALMFSGYPPGGPINDETVKRVLADFP